MNSPNHISDLPVVLIAGGNPIDINELSILLHEIEPECKLLTASDCFHVQLLVEHHIPDAVFLIATGSQMVEPCFQLRKNPRTALIPIAVFMRNPDPSWGFQALDAGANAYLPFPPQRVELAAMLKTFVQLKRALVTTRRNEELIASLLAERNETIQHQRHIQAKQELQLHRMFEQVFDVANECMFLMNSQLCFLAVNAAFCRFVNKPRHEILNKFDVEVIPEPLLSLWHEKIQEVYETRGSTTQTFQYVGRHWEINLFGVSLTNHEPGISGNMRDITDHVRVQQELENTLEDWQHTADTFDISLTLLTPDHRIRRYNRITGEMYHFPVDQLHPHCWDIFHENKKPHPQCPFERAKRSFHREMMELPVKDRLMRITVDPILDPYGNVSGCVHLLADITTERQAQEHLERMENQLQQAQKMEAIGQLAGGIAHDFNHLLTVILTGTESARILLPSEHPAAKHLHDVHSATTNLSDITRQLLAFSRKQKAQPHLMDAGEHIESILTLLRRLAGNNITLTFKRPTGSQHPIFMDAAQLTQVLVNLVTNARDAIKKTGDITITIDNIQTSNTSPGAPPAGRWVQLCVHDTGTGIPQEILSHVFEPFFTTKEDGKGTGLGLATVWGVVNQNHGFIQVESVPGEGTTFTILFPWSDPTENNRRFSDSDSITPVPDTKGTILLVEDDPQLLRITARIVADLGYRVLTANSPTHALNIATINTSIIHALVTDISLPEISGIELALQLRKKAPQLPVLFISGHNTDTVDLLLENTQLDRIYFLPKPFTRAALVRKLSETLGHGKTSL